MAPPDLAGSFAAARLVLLRRRHYCAFTRKSTTGALQATRRRPRTSGGIRCLGTHKGWHGGQREDEFAPPCFRVCERVVFDQISPARFDEWQCMPGQPCALHLRHRASAMDKWGDECRRQRTNVAAPRPRSASDSCPDRSASGSCQTSRRAGFPSPRSTTLVCPTYCSLIYYVCC